MSLTNELLDRALYDEDPDPEYEPPEEDIEPVDGVILQDNFYPFYIDGERNPALRWVQVQVNGMQIWAVIP